MDPNKSLDDKSESRLYVGNLDLRISEATLIKMFSSFGKIAAEDFMPARNISRKGQANQTSYRSGSSALMSKSANIAGIKNKLKDMELEESHNSKRQKSGWQTLKMVDVRYQAQLEFSSFPSLDPLYYDNDKMISTLF
ncbi:hypothetical protein R3W88_008847 [Solanum pinnatisectum]|uniref:RRM domain-containing protein n=1 Tax=Solanum pinnatisectum TaxID=50273 RepID=A0AAV9M9K1_9SOLN|nr:hypothetical protein R3W88_008847 [Solanum pinnatisectum]